MAEPAVPQKKQLTPLRDKHVIVVGAGVGGLVSALLLAHSGVRVTLVESAAAPGGKMRQVNAGGALIDSGPTVFTITFKAPTPFHDFPGTVGLSHLLFNYFPAWY